MTIRGSCCSRFSQPWLQPFAGTETVRGRRAQTFHLRMVGRMFAAQQFAERADRNERPQIRADMPLLTVTPPSCDSIAHIRTAKSIAMRWRPVRSQQSVFSGDSRFHPFHQISDRVSVLNHLQRSTSENIASQAMGLVVLKSTIVTRPHTAKVSTPENPA